MTIFGKRVSEYLAFAKIFLLLIAIVGIARLALSLAGVENATVKWLSISVLALLGLVYYAIRVHTSGFGSYKQDSFRIHQIAFERRTDVEGLLVPLIPRVNRGNKIERVDER